MRLDPKAKIPLKLVAEIAERAYRRGFQQGHWASETKRPTVDLTKWRFFTPTSNQNGKGYDPHYGEGYTESPLRRLKMQEWQYLNQFIIEEKDEKS